VNANAIRDKIYLDHSHLKSIFTMLHYWIGITISCATGVVVSKGEDDGFLGMGLVE